MDNFQKKKESFRQSEKWKKFRKFKYTESSKDYITHKRLRNNYNLHHLDLNPNHYQDLDDPSHFENLNSDMHSVVHKLYPFYKKDPEVLDRLKEILDRMLLINESPLD